MKEESVAGELRPGIMALPSKESLSPFLRNLLNKNFNSVDDLAAAPSVVARLQSELDRDNEKFRSIQARVLDTTALGVFEFKVLAESLRRLASEIEHVRAFTMPLPPVEADRSDDGRNVSDGISTSEDFGDEGGGAWEDLDSLEIDSVVNSSDGSALKRWSMVEELVALASEVARVERMRLYAESVLKLEQLVGDLEASITMISTSSRAASQFASCTASRRIGRAVQKMQSTENAVAEIATSNWNSLVSSVDLRVDRVAAILRPAAIGDHRGVLISIGWPPPLSVASAGGDKLSNPLLDMNEDQELRYCESFIALATLQAVQQGRKESQLKGYKALIKGGVTPRSMKSLRLPLWAVEELLSPLSSKAEPHLLKWTTKPELVFALAYRIAQEYVVVIDELLQPLIDRARLAGYSAREEWVFALVGMVSHFLQTYVLPGLANDLQDSSGVGSVGAALWLHIVDQALAFDGRMKSLAIRGSVFQAGSNEDDERDNLDTLSGPVTLSISAIADRPEWLALWARLELEDALDKLRAELQTDAAWTSKSESNSTLGLLGGSFQEGFGSSVTAVGEFIAPLGADFVLSSMSTLMDRCRSLTQPEQQCSIIEMGVMPIATEYLRELLRRCQEKEALTALVDEDSLVQVSICVNAARYCEHSLEEWGEDIFFLGLLEVKHEDSDFGFAEGSIFYEEVEKYKYFRQDWVGKLEATIIRGFEARCREYFRNKKRWSDTGNSVDNFETVDPAKQSLKQRDLLDENHVNILKAFDVSASLVDALAVLQSQLRVLRAAMDNANFFDLWRSVASALDQLLISSVVLSGAKFSDHGGWQFAADIQAVLLVFKPYCVRPSGFFKTLHDVVTLLTIPPSAALFLLQKVAPPGKFWDSGELLPENNPEFLNRLKDYGLRKQIPSMIARILNCRVLPKA